MKTPSYVTDSTTYCHSIAVNVTRRGLEPKSTPGNLPSNAICQTLLTLSPCPSAAVLILSCALFALAANLDCFHPLRFAPLAGVILETRVVQTPTGEKSLCLTGLRLESATEKEILRTVLFCLVLIIHAHEGFFFFAFRFSGCKGARTTYVCAHARCVCL